MNLLFSRKRKASIVVICICLFSYSFTAILEKDDSFLAVCKKSEAYFLHSYTDVSYQQNWSSFKRYTSIDNKLVINTTKGVENYAFLKLDDYISNHLESIKIKTLKADGSIIELDSSIVFKKKGKHKKFGAINYPIPGVEPGDTIQTSYVFYEYLKKPELMSYVGLYKDLPSLNSQYSIQTLPQFLVRYKTYNNFPDPKVISNDTIVYAQFSKDSLRGVKEKKFTCLPCEKPYLYYSIKEKGDELRTWKDVYNEEFNFLTQPMALDYDRSSYYKRWKRRVIGSAKDSSKYFKFHLLYKEVLKSFKMEPLNPIELIKSSGYFLKEKRFNPHSIKRFYRQVLEDLDIEYWAVFAREKHSGEIDVNYIRKGEFQKVFFAFENEKGFLEFIYPHEDSFMYQISEIPTSLYNTNAVLVKPHYKGKKKRKDKFISRDFKIAKVDSVAFTSVTLPGMNSKKNYILQTFSNTIDIEKKTTSFRCKSKISGGLSTDLRSFFDMLNQNKEASDFYDALSEFEGNDNTIQVDSVTSISQIRKKPFSYKISTMGKLKNAVSFINDSLISISIKELIHHNELDVNTRDSDLSYYLNYSYGDYLRHYINFPSNIEVIGIENSDIDFKNDFGEYFFKLKKSKDNQITLESNYKILRDLIPKEKLIELEFLNEQVKKIKNKRFIVKLVSKNN